MSMSHVSRPAEWLEILSPAQLADMREWLAACWWRDLESDEVDDVDCLSDLEIVRGIFRHYDGGIEAFVSDFAAC